MESFDNSSNLKYNTRNDQTNSITIYSMPNDDTRYDSNQTYGHPNENSLVYEQLNDIDENIILCWESYALPLQELVKSTSIYERNMLEYYR